MAVVDYLDDVFAPVYGNEVPRIHSFSAEKIARALYMAIMAEDKVFIYGDYDMDGLCCQMVWDVVLRLAGLKNIEHFKYVARTHALDRDILRQVEASDAQVVIVCDTGSSEDDAVVRRMLENTGRTVIVIDHHNFYGDYTAEMEKCYFFNSTCELDALSNEEVSGAYASLLVATILCEEYCKIPLPFDAKVWALASMYSDGVDLSSKIGRALYNCVALGRATGPFAIKAMNKWNYLFSRRLFSFIVTPQINACFRAEEFAGLNRLVSARDRIETQIAVDMIGKVRDEILPIRKQMVNLFEQDGDDIILAVHQATEETLRLNVGNYTGFVAQSIASEKQTAVIAVVHDSEGYHGSYRDFYGRAALNRCKLFMEAGGHPAAFGVRFKSIGSVRKHLNILKDFLSKQTAKQDTYISGNMVQTVDDVDTLALYNEYANVRSKIMIEMKVKKMDLVRSTSWTKVYDVGLPVTVSTHSSIYLGESLILEPCICGKVELRGVT